MSWLIRLLPNWFIFYRYKKTGGEFGNVVSYVATFGECVGFESVLNVWAKWEREYARRGYHTIVLDQFVDYGGWGTPLKGFGVKREIDEKIVLHAEIYRERYLGKVAPAIDLGKLMSSDEVQFGTYKMPSTKDVNDEV